MSQFENQTSAERCLTQQFDFVAAIQQLKENGIGDDRGSNRAPFQKLVSTIEKEIIPRLMMAHVVPSPTPAPTQVSEGKPGKESVAEFTRIVLHDDALLASSYVRVMQTQGMSLESIYLHLFAPTARRLGEMWETDECGFTEVTIGLCRLHEVLREFSLGHENEGMLPETERSVMLMPVPGDQHTFGITMVSEFFRHAGWSVRDESGMSSDELNDTLRNEWFDIVGLSLSSEVWLDGLGAVIHSVRKVSRNRDVGVMVGGSMFVKRPELAVLVGADATACDGRQAVLQANRLLTLVAARCHKQHAAV
jgi:MerR family transcriptional regulator, light-induced transcriptional regulator